MRIRTNLVVGLTLAVITLVGAACEETITVGNTPASITAVGPVSLVAPANPTRSASELRIEYGIRDLEQDDQDITVHVCEWTCSGDDCEAAECGAAWQGEGGDGTSRVPTVPQDIDDETAVHVFVWRFSCGRFVDGSLVETREDQEYVVGITPADSGQELVLSEPFAVTDFDVSDIPECE